MGGCVSCNAGNEPGAQEATVASGAPQRDKAAAREAARRAKRATGPMDPDASAKAVRQANEEGLELLRSSDQPGASPKKSTGFQNVGKYGDRYFANIEVDGKTVRSLGGFQTAEEAALEYARSPEIRPTASKRFETRQAAARALMCFDGNGNGLDRAEFTDAMGAFKLNRRTTLMKKSVEQIFAQCDTDGNGRLSAKDTPVE